MCAINCVLAQNPTGAINGTVTDPSNAVIPGASIATTNLATGASRNLVTGHLGTFRFDNLPPGDYFARKQYGAT